MSRLRTVGEQSIYWEIEVPIDFIAEFNRITFGKHRQTVNVWQWDLVRRASRKSWLWVAQWVYAGYPEPPAWIILQIVKELVDERERHHNIVESHPPWCEYPESGCTCGGDRQATRRTNPHWRADGGP